MDYMAYKESLKCLGFTESQKGYSWKGPLEVIWSSLPALAESPPHRLLLKIVFRWFFNISKAGDSTTSLRYLFQYLSSQAVKKCLMMFRGNLCVSVYAQCPLAAYGTHWKDTGSFFAFFEHLHTMVKSPWSSCSSGWIVLDLSAFPPVGGSLAL